MKSKILKPNNTYRFTLLGQPQGYAYQPKESYGSSKPRQRYTIDVMPDDSIFFARYDISTTVCKMILEAIVEGMFEDGNPRFEITVRDSLYGRWEVTPLNWERLSLSPYYEGEYEQQCECECHVA
jgi:hypothetical protein